MSPSGALSHADVTYADAGKLFGTKPEQRATARPNTKSCHRSNKITSNGIPMIETKPDLEPSVLN